MANILHHATSILDRFDLVNTAIDCLIKVNDINEKILVAKYNSEFCFERRSFCPYDQAKFVTFPIRIDQ